MSLQTNSDKKFGDYVVSYPAYKAANDVLEHYFTTESSKPRAVLVHGPSGVGKSFIIKKLMEAHKVRISGSSGHSFRCEPASRFGIVRPPISV